jgi:clan AA aspartic protease (TIGR02281 family)
MRPVLVLRVSFALLAAAGVHFARQSQSTPLAPAQSGTTDQQFRFAPTQSEATDRKLRPILVQLPSIDRPNRVLSHDIVSTTRYRGNFFFQTEVNGAAMPMMFDTGARMVSLRAEDAERAGIDVSSLNFSLRTATANGIGSAAPVVIREMKVGTITRTNIPAVVMRPGALAVNLLGQSFMTTMAGFSTEGDRLTLRGN